MCLLKGTGFDGRKESPAMFPRPSKNMWQLKDNGWTPRHYPNEIYSGSGPYVSNIHTFVCIHPNLDPEKLTEFCLISQNKGDLPYTN